MRLSRKLGRVQYNGHRDIDRWQHDEMDQPGFLEETASEYGCTSKRRAGKEKRGTARVDRVAAPTLL
ncbi:hypothetical protein BsIDN1_47690 [Bacillus safensis]|uniref:Uncharacterized protein n=1 Tax=Bacillus safensis TaxID=561879 RepID=A0A5S9MDZ4_BACIA|nr:hypothetical protein BsIDN1_47690 [Bacillus safensis]